MFIRSITFSSDWKDVNKKSTEQLIKNFFKIANKEIIKSNYNVRTNRLNLSPFVVQSQYEGKDIHAIINWLSLFCKKNKVETLWGIGGNDKSNSSSWILKKWQEKN